MKTFQQFRNCNLCLILDVIWLVIKLFGNLASLILLIWLTFQLLTGHSVTISLK